LKEIFDSSQGATNLFVHRCLDCVAWANVLREILADKEFHKIFEVIFTATLSEKKSYLSALKATKPKALNRLVACAEATRAIVQAGVTKLKSRTVEAIVEHITQTLPLADGSFLEPIAATYLRILSTIFRHTAHIEHLKSNIWQDLIDFCLLGINRFLDDHEGDTAGLNRSFSVLGSGSLARGAQDGKEASCITRQDVEYLFHVVVLLVSASNSPLSTRYEVLADSTIRFLQLPSSSASQVHQLCFSVLNAILNFSRADHISFSLSLAQKVIPTITHFFQGRFIHKDEMLNSVRDEMLIMLVHVHLHLQKAVCQGNAELLTMVETLSDVLAADYAKRDSRDQLCLDDLEMIDIGIGTINSYPFGLQTFRPKAHNTRDERTWVQLQLISVLERIIRIGHRQGTSKARTDNDQGDGMPRKRQKTSRPSERLLNPFAFGNTESKLGHLHLLPFMLNDYDLEIDELSALLQRLLQCMHDKQPGIASWALLAVSR
jgi:ataxia telangiectasia mutated family protein